MGRQSNYSTGIYNQLQEVMERLSAMEHTHQQDHSELRRLNCVVKSQENELATLRATAQKQNEELDSLRVENKSLKEENIKLKNDNERMKRILNNNSSNTSLPPSSDPPGKAANTYNGRKRSGKKKGGQAGHKGTGLTKEAVEERIRQGKLQHKIETIGLPCGRYVVRYRLDLDIQAIATEIRIYQDENGKYPVPASLKAEVSYGPAVKSMISFLYSEGVVSNERISGFINSISGDALAVSGGTIYNACRQFSELCRKTLPAIEEDLLNSTVLCTDATVMTINGAQAYIRNISNPRSARYVGAAKKTIKSMMGMPVLPQFTGIIEHDHETALYHFGTGHGECNVHLCRYLKKNTEETGNSWSRNLEGFLKGMAHAIKEKKAGGETRFTEEELLRYEARYDAIVGQGEEQGKTTKGKYAREEEQKLLRRLKKYRKSHLLFLHNFEVPFSDNMSERDLRKCKNRQKMAGGFRLMRGMEMYCSILSFIETVKRRKMNIYFSIISLFNGVPVIK